MDLATRIRVAKRDVFAAFEQSETKVFTLAEIRELVNHNREHWRLPQSTTGEEFLDVMFKLSPLKEVRLDFPNRPKPRYTWGEVSLFTLLHSLDPDACFCHYSAIYLHGLTEQIPKTIYLNVEQRMRGGGGTLTQGGIDRAFKNKCRTSKNFVNHKGRRIYLLNGGNTDQLGVTQLETSETASPVRVTDIERTLIDATVRPVYSGGVHEVAKAFKTAHGRLSVNKLVAYLRKLNYTYPYHQSIGFYLERAGEYRESQIDLLRQLPMHYDFYLTYQMDDPEYVSRWRLFAPKGF